MILNGDLKSGEQLPSTRDLASDLHISRGTAVTALELLIAEGLLVARQGSGTFISDDCVLDSPVLTQAKLLPARRLKVKPDIDPAFSGPLNFQACRPSTEAFPQIAWRQAAAYAASRMPTSEYGDPRGELELRIAISSYLRRTRGFKADPDEIIITNGAIQAMHILARLYLTENDSVAFEDPGYPLARQVFAMTGASILPVDVDEHGLMVDALPDNGDKLKFVYVTPSHQFPTGERLSLSRRKQLLEWAAKNDVLILEDDYDGEFRYDVPPLPPMAAMSANGYVVYFGTFSKTMFPGLRLGFAVAPSELIAEMAAYRSTTDYQTNALTQLALARFIDKGDFEKHVQRMRRIYAKKRACLSQAIQSSKLPGKLTGTDSGINAMIKLDPGLRASEISQRALKAGVNVTPIDRYRYNNTLDDALVLGYGGLSTEQIQTGIDTLAHVI